MCGVVMRGAVALPGSEATSRTKGSRWNLGDLVWPAVAVAIPGRGRKARSRSCRGTGEESDDIHDAEVGLRRGVALFGRLAHPFRCLGIVPLDALAVVVHAAEAGLRAGIALLSKRPT